MKSTSAEGKTAYGGFLAALLRSWFGLTKEEQRALIIVLALFILGLAVRYCHIRQSPNSAALPQEVEPVSEP